MELLYIFIAMLVVIVGLLIYGIYNTIRKLEKLEEVVDSQVAYIRKISDIISDSRDNINKLDQKGAFESDDEVGNFFKSLKQIQQILNTFIVPQGYGKKKS
jgi:cell division protein FtsB